MTLTSGDIHPNNLALCCGSKYIYDICWPFYSLAPLNEPVEIIYNLVVNLCVHRITFLPPASATTLVYLGLISKRQKVKLNIYYYYNHVWTRMSFIT